MCKESIETTLGFSNSVEYLRLNIYHADISNMISNFLEYRMCLPAAHDFEGLYSILDAQDWTRCKTKMREKQKLSKIVSFMSTNIFNIPSAVG